MLDVRMNMEDGIALLEPHGPLSQQDFETATALVDPFIEKTGRLNGVIIHSKAFPGWDSFAALISHLRFVRDHHRKVSRVAFATDSPVGGLAEAVGSHFVAAEVKRFHFHELGKARDWILGSDQNEA